MRALRLTLAALTLAAALWLGSRGAGPLPPLGPFLDPAHGAWAGARAAVLPSEARARVPGLGAAVEVRYDHRGVPHIFAATEEDAYRALGYVVARDRLFQLELQAYASAGRLTELVGAAALDADREMRRLGLPRAAERTAASLGAGSSPSASWLGGSHASAAAVYSRLALSGGPGGGRGAKSKRGALCPFG